MASSAAAGPTVEIATTHPWRNSASGRAQRVRKKAPTPIEPTTNADASKLSCSAVSWDCGACSSERRASSAMATSASAPST